MIGLEFGKIESVFFVENKIYYKISSLWVSFVPYVFEVLKVVVYLAVPLNIVCSKD